MSKMHCNDVTGQIIDAAMKGHSALGPGLLESAYQSCLQFELCRRGFDVKCQVEMPIEYDGFRIEAGYRLDLLVENLVVVEIKAVAALLPIHQAQLLSYVKLSRKPVGLLISFHVEHLREGIRRLAN
jgi:GxxExxY protein